MRLLLAPNSHLQSLCISLIFCPISVCLYKSSTQMKPHIWAPYTLRNTSKVWQKKERKKEKENENKLGWSLTSSKSDRWSNSNGWCTKTWHQSAVHIQDEEEDFGLAVQEKEPERFSYAATERQLTYWCSPGAWDWDPGRIFKSLSLCSWAVTQHNWYKALIAKMEQWNKFVKEGIREGRDTSQNR